MTARASPELVNSARPSEARPVTALTVRACCVILHDGQVALIHRQRPGGDQYSLPGGLVHADEEVPAALARELNEELGLDVTALPCRPELRWVQDQITTRPGSTAPFRRLHLIHVLPGLPPHARHAMSATEQDAEGYARIVWKRIGQAAHLHLYPAAGAAIETLAGTCGQPAPVLLPPITDQSFRWR
jgi:8-oxo-dGTP pyrophosphatase MutT (NUDIX family)